MNVVCLIRLNTTGRSYLIPKSDNLKLVLSANDFTALVMNKKDCNHRIFFSVLYNIYINLHCISECRLRIDIEGKTNLFGRKLRFFIPSLYILFSLKTHINIYLQQLTTLHGTFSTRDLRFSDDIFENSN